MATDTSNQTKDSRTPGWLIGLVSVGAVIVAGYFYFNRQSATDDLKFAFAADHYFENPMVFYGGKGLRFQVNKPDTRLLKVYVPVADLSTPKYLLAEDGELDYLGFVHRDRSFIPLQLFQIHNVSIGHPEAPVSDCKTYLEFQASSDTIRVMVDEKYVLRGTRVGPNMYTIPFCETTREHQFQILGEQNRALALNGQTPVVYSMVSKSGLTQPSSKFNYRLRSPGDTIRMAGLAPMQYSSLTNPEPTTLLQAQKGDKPAMTKVIFSMPRKMTSPWVYLNDKRFTDFTLNAAGTQVSFWVKQDGKAVSVRVGDSNCECQGSGRALHPVLELGGYCECRDILVTVDLDPGLDRFRSKIKIYIDGQLTDLQLPPAGQPFTFPVRKTDQDQFVAMKLLMADDTGKAGLIDVCSFTVPREATTVNLKPNCHCVDCPPNIKVSGS